MADLDAFHDNFFNQARAAADASGDFLEAAFLDLFCAYLTDSGEFDIFDPAHYRAPRGMRVDGYGGDPAEADGVLTLVISDFSADPKLATLTRTEAEAAFRRLGNFLKAALTDAFRDELEEESQGYGLAELIAARRPQITRARLFLVSNRSLSAQVSGMPDGDVGGLPVSYNIWDVSRLHRLVASGKAREDIEIDPRRRLRRDYRLPARRRGRRWVRGLSSCRSGSAPRSDLRPLRVAAPRAERPLLPAGPGQDEQGHPAYHPE